jgi:hypothetical protein
MVQLGEVRNIVPVHEGGCSVRRFGGTNGSGAKWVIAALIVACVAVGVVVVAAFTTRNDGEPNPGRKELNTPTSLATFVDNPAVRQSIGAIVYLNNVQLHPGPTSNTFIARDRNGRELLVRSNNVQTKLPEAGAMADVSGIVMPLPSAATLKSQWKLDKKEAERVRKDVVYIEAERIKPEERRMQATSRKPEES